MRKFIIYVSLWFCLAGLVFSQSSRSNENYGAKGLAMTEEILAQLSLPIWCWNGAHVFENVEQNYRLVDGELLDEFFTMRPAKGLNDPQHILHDEQRERIEELIAAHDMKSAMPLCVNVLEHGQKLSLTEDELKLRLREMFKDKSALVIFYYYGYARGVKGYVLLDELGFIEDWEVNELFLKSARDASVQVEDFLEMESFVTDVSKRSYWLEQRLIPPVVAKKSNDQEANEKKKRGYWDELLLIFTNHTMTIVLAFWVLATGGWYFLWSRKWRKFVIPDGGVPVRLSADYGANVSDPIEFSDPKISLTEQHEKLKSREL
jgi:hypothetical protein